MNKSRRGDYGNAPNTQPATPGKGFTPKDPNTKSPGKAAK